MADNLNSWIQYISGQSIPVFNCSVQSVLKLTRDEHSSNKQLADMILCDASLTSRVLKIVNSPYYNRHEEKIYDLRQAILFIGFNKIQEICVTLVIVDRLVNKNTHRHLARLLSKSFHTAILAKALAVQRGIQKVHEIYIAALLYQYGEIAFWSLSGRAGDEINHLLDQPGITAEKAQQNLMGITFKQLTLELTAQWHISSLLKAALLDEYGFDQRAMCVYDAHRLAELIQLTKDDPKRRVVITEIADEMDIPQKQLQQVVTQNEVNAKKMYQFYLAS